MNFKEKMTSLVGLLLLFIAVAKTNTPLKVEHPISWLTWTIIGCVAGLVLFVLIYSDLKKTHFFRW